jgi:phytol kinase
VRDSILYFALVLVLGEIARRRLRIPPDVTRKAVLAALAVWAAAAASRPESSHGVSAAFFGLAGALYLSFRFEIIAAIEDEGPTLGSVLAPLSLALLLAVLGGRSPHIAAASALSIVGDSAAGLLGRRHGTRKYHVLGHARTMEGTLTLFLVSGLAMAPALGVLGGADWHQSIAFALIAATVGASAETVSPHGTDNATVPLSVAVTLLLLTSATG